MEFFIEQSVYITGDAPVHHFEDLARAKAKEVTTLIAPALQKPENVVMRITRFIFSKNRGIQTQGACRKGGRSRLILGEPNDTLLSNKRAHIGKHFSIRGQ